MADATPKTEGHKGARKHTGLGRGLGALIPQAGEQKSPTPPAPPARPLDVFFPEGPAASGRGGSAKDLLQPKRATASSNKKRHAMPTLDIGAARRTVNASNPLGSGINGSAPDQSGSTPRVVPVETVAQSVPDVSRETSEENELLPVPGASFAEIAIDQIVPNAKQPRLRASELAGETTIPAIIREIDDGDLLRDALLENLHRAQLNPLEEASAYQQLMADFGATQEELAKRIARSRPQIANTLRLLKLPPTVQKKVAAQVITAGHARALLSLDTAEDMERLSERIVAEGLSVRTTEEIVRVGKVKATPRPRARKQEPLSALGESVVTALSDAYDTRVSITEGQKKGRIVIEFAGADDLQRIADLILH